MTTVTFPVAIHAPVTTRAKTTVFEVMPRSLDRFGISLYYWFVLELALAGRNDHNIIGRMAEAHIDALDRALGNFDMAVGSLRGHVGEDAASVLMARLDEIGLPTPIVNEIYEMRHGHPPNVVGIRMSAPHMTLLQFVLSNFTQGDVRPMPEWMPTVDAALAPLGLRHHMTIADIVVDASTVGRVPARPGLLPLRVRRPVWMAYGKPLEALELPAPLLADLKDNLGMRFVFEIGFLSERFIKARHSNATADTINGRCMRQNMWLRVGSLYDEEDGPPPRISTYGMGLMNKGVVQKSGDCTLMALVMQTPEQLGLTEDEAREGREFLAHQALDFGRHLHDVIRETDI